MNRGRGCAVIRSMNPSPYTTPALILAVAVILSTCIHGCSTRHDTALPTSFIYDRATGKVVFDPYNPK